MPIKVASREEFEGVRKIWEEQFTTDTEYLQTMFTRIMPLCTSYIHKEGDKILSVASFMPMQFKDSSSGTELLGWYMFGVATLKEAQGRKLAAGIILEAIKEFGSKNYHFIFERPAYQSLNHYYLKLGFSKPEKKIPYRFSWLDNHCSTGNITTEKHLRTLSEKVLQDIRSNFSKRFEWAHPQLLLGLTALGEIQYNNENLNNSTKEETYIAIHPLNNTDPTLFNNVFFCFPME